MARPTHEQRINKLEKESRDMREIAEDTNGRVKKLDEFLLGDEYDKELNGGFLKFVKTMSKTIDNIERRREWMKGAWWASIGLVAFLATVVFTNWDKIFR